MGIQSTKYITRQEAEQIAVKSLTDKISGISLMEDSDLEDMLDEHFYNYIIK